jgi:hypothetical protein
MNRDEIIRMARKAGMVLGYPFLPEHLERFAELVEAAERKRCYDLIETLVKAEREECARVCESAKAWEIASQYQGDIYAAAIRARGE